MSDASPLRWGIVGPGEIAAVFAESLRESRVGEVEAVFGRDAKRRQQFGYAHECRPHDSLNALLADSEVEAVYVATPHPAHAQVVRAALEAGKPVLCEKPLTISATETRSLWDIAAQTGTPLFEAWMYRCHPQLEWCLDTLRSEVLGKPMQLEATFSFAAEFDAQQRLWNPELGGGGILDVGGYPVSLALAIARTTGGWRRDERADVQMPVLEHAHAELAPTGVDQHAEATLRFGEHEDDPFIAKIAVSLDREAPRSTTITCENGVIMLSDPYLPGGTRRGRLASVAFVLAGCIPETKLIDGPLDPFAAEAKAFADHVRAPESHPIGSTPWPMVDREESIAIATLLERWREAVGSK